MIYLLLIAGLFMGWSLGTVDSASAFSTAVATRVVKYRTAVIIIAIFVVVGAFISGQTNITRVAELAISNDVLFSPEDVKTAIEDNTVALLQTKAALKAAIIYASAGLTVFIMSYLKFPVSSNQSITGAIIGWGLFYADYSNPEILNLNLTQIGRFALTWLLNPLCACGISFGLVWLIRRFVEARLETLSGYDKIITWGYLLAGVLASYSIGLNSSANVMALYYDASFAETGVVANLITNPRMAATIGGIAIAIGALTFSRRVMMTVGTRIAEISQLEGFIVVIAMALTVVLMGNCMGIPVSNSQAIVGAVMGAGLTRGVKNVHFGVLKNIAIAWVSSPTVAGLMAYIIAFCTKGYFGT